MDNTKRTRLIVGITGATGTIFFTGTLVGLLSPPGVLDLSYQGSVCTA